VVGQLRDPRTLAILAAGVDRLYPRGFRGLEDHATHGVVELVADREPDPASRQSLVNACVHPPMSVRTRISRSRSSTGSCASAKPSTVK